MALRGIIVNTSNKINPLRHWNNAVWFYQWLEVEPDTTHCILLAFIPIVTRDVPLAKLDGFKWVKLEGTFTLALTVTPELGRILAMRHVTENTLRLIVGDAIFSKDSSPPPPLHKKYKAQGQFHTEDSMNISR